MEESIKANNTNNDVKMNKGIKFDKIQIKIASPEDIRNWSYGEKKKKENKKTENNLKSSSYDKRRYWYGRKYDR